MSYSYKFRIYPDKNQKKSLYRWNGICRYVYNWLIIQNDNFFKDNKELYEKDKKEFYKKHKEWSGLEYGKLIARAKQDEATSFFKLVPAHTLSSVGAYFHLAWKSYFKRGAQGAGRPTKHKFKYNVGLYFHNKSGILNWKDIDLTEGKKFSLKLAKIGEMKGVCHRTVRGRILGATLSSQGNKWFISFTTNFERPVEYTSTNETVGIDRGVTDAAVCDDGVILSSIDVSKEEGRIKFYEKKLARQVFKSKSYNKTKIKIDGLKARQKRIRLDKIENFTHNVASKYAVVVIENLDVKKMTKRKKGEGRKQKSRLNSGILNNSWGLMSQKLELKSARFGGEVKKVNPAYSSQTCSSCGCVDEKNRNEKIFKCIKCDFTTDADLNAALVIKNRGLLGDCWSAGESSLVGETKNSSMVEIGD